MSSRRRSVVINGKLVSGDEVNAVCKRKGLCTSCGEVKTHRRVRQGLVRYEMEPLTVKNFTGAYSVYKGYCIRPLCYSLDQAKRELGEISSVQHYNQASSKHTGSRTNFFREEGSIADDSTLSSHDISTGGRSGLISIGSSENLTDGRNGFGRRQTGDHGSHGSEPSGGGSYDHVNLLAGGTTRSVSSGSTDTKKTDHYFEPLGHHTGDNVCTSSESTKQFRRRHTGDHGSHGSDTSAGSSYNHRNLLSRGATRSASSESTSFEPLGGGRSGDHVSRHSQNSTDSQKTGSSREFRRGSGYNQSSHSESFSAGRISDAGSSRSSFSAGSTNYKRSSDKRVSFEDTSTEAFVSAAKIDQEPTNPVILKFEEYARRGDYSSLVDKLCSEWNNADVVERAFELIRNGIHDLDTAYAFSSSTWVKYLMTAMENQSKRPHIQAQGILMFWTLCTISPRYMKDVSKGSSVGAIVGIMNRYKMEDNVLEYACGFLECLTGNEKDGMNMQHSATRKAIPELVRTLHEKSNYVAKDLAMRALFNLSQQINSNYSGPSLAEQIQNALPYEQGVVAIVNLIRNEETQEWGARLAQGIFGQSYSCDNSREYDSEKGSNLLQILVDLLNSSQDVGLKEAAFGMISSQAFSAAEQGDCLPEETVQSAAESVILAMSSHRSKPDLQLSAIDVLLAFSIDPHHCRNLAHMDIVPFLLEALQSFGNNVQIQGAACLTLSYLCIHNEESKSALVAGNGVDELCDAFRTFVVNDDQSQYPPEAVEKVKNGVCATLASLTASNDTISVVKKSGIFWEMDVMTVEGDNAQMNACVHTMFQNILASTWRLDEQISGDFQTTIDMIMKHLKTTSQEEEACSMIALAFDLSLKSPICFDNVLSSDNGRAMNILLKTMETHPKSAFIQLNGCALLGNIYVRLHYNGKLKQKTSITIGRKTFDIETHTEREVQVLAAAMNNHKGDAKIQEYACDALANFVTGANSPEDPSEIQASLEVSQVYSGILKKVVDALSIHEQSPDVIKSASRLFSVLVFLNCGDDLRRMGPHGTSKLLEAMSKFRRDEELHLLACSVFVKLVEDEENGKFLGEDDGIRSLLECLKFDNESLAASSAEILLKILKTNFLASNYFMEIEDSVETVVLCMMAHTQSAPVQHFTCSLLATLASLHDDFVKGLIASGGGLNAIQNAMTNHKKNPTVTASACGALGTIISGVHPTLIVGQSHSMFTLIMTVMQNHKGHSEVNGAAVLVLSEICDRDPTFRESIGDMHGIPKIIDAMTQHLENEDVQLNGISLIWKISSYPPNKNRLGRGGAKAVINGMLFHINSSLIQQEAMTALKNLATDSAGQQNIVELGGVAAIVSSMWCNMNSKTVLCGAFSALNNMAINGDTKQVAVADQGELPPICFGMKRYPLDQDVQKCAVFLLKTYTFAPSNIEMIQFQDHLPSLLTSAAHNFPHDCEERADYILSRI